MTMNNDIIIIAMCIFLIMDYDDYLLFFLYYYLTCEAGKSLCTE